MVAKEKRMTQINTADEQTTDGLNLCRCTVCLERWIVAQERQSVRNHRGGAGNEVADADHITN
jgi:hypothetical protein